MWSYVSVQPVSDVIEKLRPLCVRPLNPMKIVYCLSLLKPNDLVLAIEDTLRAADQAD